MTNVERDRRIVNGLRIAGWGLAAVLLLAPLVAMRFTDAVQWTAFDFAVAAAMLLTAGGAMELAVRLSGSWPYRIGCGVAVLGAFLLFWATGAVGIIGSENEAANLLYFGVLLIGAGVAAFSGFRARGMAVAMVAMAVAQTVVGVAAVARGWGATDPSWPVDILGATGVFTVMWLLAAGLFRRAAQG